MKAAQLITPGCLNLVDTAIPVPSVNQVRVKIEGCGVCGSNIPVWEGREWFNYPLEPGNPGHESWGIVDATGEGVTKFHPGDRVTMLSNNAFAEYDIANESAVVKISFTLDGKPFPGEPLGCVMNIFKRSDIKEGDTVAIIGAGFLGALLTQLASKAGAQVIAISRREFSLEIAKRMGASHTVKMDDHWEVINRVKDITGRIFCDKVIEAVGLQWPLDLAGELVRERGRLVIAGYHQDSPRSVNMQLWNWRGIDVINAHEREEKVYISGIEDAVKAVEEGVLTPDLLYTEFNADQINDAFKSAVERPDGFIKALIRFS
jgi:threonine dehydrogenase-like Zn-dependent dehydrogenase